MTDVVAVTAADLVIDRLGECRVDSPMLPLLETRQATVNYVAETDRVLLDDTLSTLTGRSGEAPGFEPGGPRRRIYFDPAKTRVGIVTCGGLCPGLNNVIRALVMELTLHYQVRRIWGFRNGYQGFVARYGYEAVELTPASVRNIHEDGGTVLGSSRGGQDAGEIVDALERMSINVLFVIGGDGSMRGAMKIAAEASSRGDRIAVVGVPKTIDNDIPFIDHSFGFQTAFGAAGESIMAAKSEARSAPSGVGLVRLMGRHSGFIACYAALAKNHADFVLIPEVPFSLSGLLAALSQKVKSQGHAVVVVAEGAGQEHLIGDGEKRDASGNLALGDIGTFLRSRITASFAEAGEELNLRYIDPSYTIRSVPANPYDSVYCLRLAHAAVHAAMAGRTAMVIGRWHGRFVHVPMSLAVSGRNQVDPHGDLWMSVLEATGQPPVLTT